MKISSAVVLLCFSQEKPKDQLPIANDKTIIEISIHSSAKKPKPQRGNTEIMKGMTAQWIAQNVEAVIPILSNLLVSVSGSMEQM